MSNANTLEQDKFEALNGDLVAFRTLSSTREELDFAIDSVSASTYDKIETLRVSDSIVDYIFSLTGVEQVRVRIERFLYDLFSEIRITTVVESYLLLETGDLLLLETGDSIVL